MSDRLLGHDMGDELLRQVADRLQSSLRAADVVARIGGDEFTVLLAGIDNDAAATTVAGHIIDKLIQPYILTRGQARTSASIGIVRYPQKEASPDWLMYKADQAMYAAKAAGKARYLIAGSNGLVLPPLDAPFMEGNAPPGHSDD